MRQRIAFFLLLLSSSIASAGPQEAVVRIPSHGGSGTVIATGQGWTLILTCGHMFAQDSEDGKLRPDPKLIHKKIALDILLPSKGAPIAAGVDFLGADWAHDICAIRLNYGPLPNVSPVAPRGFKPGPCLSIGFDEMKLPAKTRPATIVATNASSTFTRERPWHGRSGGGLIDQQTGYLVGVVGGYQRPEPPPGREWGPNDPQVRAEVYGSFKGVYASHQAILSFLARCPQVNFSEGPEQDPFAPPLQAQPQQQMFPPPAGQYAQPVPWTPGCPSGR